MRFFNQRLLTGAALGLVLFSTTAVAHTVSIGYESAGTPGSVTFWYGTYHVAVPFTEGSLNVTDGGSYNSTIAFSLLTTTKPTGLLDGTTNFYSDGSVLGTVNNYQTPVTWQGSTLTGLTAGTYTFTYIPIASPTAEWDPIDSLILSSTVTLDATIVSGGGDFEDNSNHASHGAAQVLDDLNGTATGDMGDAISTLEGLSADQQTAILQHLAPQAGVATGQASNSLVTGALDSVQVRLDSVRTSNYGSEVANNLQNGESVQLAYNDTNTGDLVAPITADSAAWMKLFGSFGSQNTTGNYAGYHDRTGGFSMGGDTRIHPKWIVGGAFTYAATDVDMRDQLAGDSTEIDSYQLTAYSSYDFSDWYMEGMLAYARQAFNTSRNTILNGTARGDYDGNQFASRMTANKPYDLGKHFTLTPSAGLEVNYMDQDAYTETGAGVLNLSNDSVGATRVRGLIGQRLSYEAYVNHEYRIQPSLQVTWKHEFLNDGISYSSSFAGGGATFSTPGQDLTRDAFDFAANVNVTSTDNMTVSLQLGTTQAAHYSGYSGQLQAKIGF